MQQLQADVAAGVAEGLTQMHGLAVRAGQLDEQLSRSLQAEVRQGMHARTHAHMALLQVQAPATLLSARLPHGKLNLQRAQLRACIPFSSLARASLIMYT